MAIHGQYRSACIENFKYRGGNPYARAIGRTRGSLAASPRGLAQSPCNQSATQLHHTCIDSSWHACLGALCARPC